MWSAPPPCPQLGRSESELLAAELADACPATGWPAPAYGYLTRAGVTAPWEAQPPACLDPHPQQQGAPGDEGPDAPEDVALVDPLAGALQMGLLQRIRWVPQGWFCAGKKGWSHGVSCHVWCHVPRVW